MLFVFGLVAIAVNISAAIFNYSKQDRTDLNIFIASISMFSAGACFGMMIMALLR